MSALVALHVLCECLDSICPEEILCTPRLCPLEEMLTRIRTGANKPQTEAEIKAYELRGWPKNYSGQEIRRV